MKFECESCHAQYMIADEKVGKRGVKVKCKRCSHVIIVRPDGAPAEAAPASAGAGAPPKESKARVEVAERSKVSPTDAPPNLESTSPKQPPVNIERSNHGHEASEPETTGPARPAPVSMIAKQGQANDTQLGDAQHSDAAPPSWEADKTEMGKLPDLDANGEMAEPKVAAKMAPVAQPPSTEMPEKTVVQTAAIPEPPPAPKPAPAPAPAPLAAAPAAPNVKGESSIGDALDDQLAGAFNNMFDEGRPGLDALGSGEAPEDQRGPTRVLDLDAMNALRKQTAAPPQAGVDADALDSLRKDFSPQSDESSGLWDEKKSKAAKKPKQADGADDGPADAVWHAAIDDEDVGPLSLAELGRHIESGRVDRDSLVWKSGMDDWLPAGEIDAVKALFDRVPMPRIASSEPESTGQKAKKPNSFDVGAPIDDMGGGGSPFDNAPPAMEESDPAWRPHGLTDVYQAANLAEAAGASAGFGAGAGGGLIGGAAGMSARSGGPSAPPAPAEAEWRPSASSALASLVNDEIDRLSKGPMPADDDDLAPRPADDASLNGGIGGMGGGGSLPFSNLAGVDLDGGPELSDPGRRPQQNQQMGMVPSAPGFDVAPPQFGGGGGFAPPVQPPGRSPLIYVAFAGMGLMMVLVLGLVAKVLLAPPPTQQVVMIGPDGRPIQPGVPIAAPPITAPVTTPPVTPPPTTTTTPPVAATTTPPTTTTTPPTTDPANTTATTPPTTATEPVKVADATTPPTTNPLEKDKPIKATAGGNKTKVVGKTKVDPDKGEDPPEKVTPVKTSTATNASGKPCDPVLDFDCNKKTAPEPKAEAKDTLEKADILAVVKGALPKVKACGQKNKASGTIKMSWKIETSGKTNDVAVADQKYAGTPTGTCVIGVIKAMKFPAAKKAPPPVSIPLPLQ